LAASIRRLLAVLALAAGSAVPLAAQASIELAGRVVRLAGADSVPLPRVSVSAHRVGKTLQGVVDSALAGPGGTFRFRFSGDTAAIYLVSARFGGVEYFSEPVRAPGAAHLLVVVSDTSSTAPVSLSARHVIVSRPDPGGGRAILDLFTLRNSSTMTRVARDTMTPTWRVVLPEGALEPAVEEGDISGAAVAFRGDTLLLFAPVAPGLKRMMLSYHLPVAETRPRWTAPADSFDLLVEEADATVQGAGLVPVAPVTLMDRNLRRWSLWTLVGVVGVVVIIGGAAVLRRRPRPVPARRDAPTDWIGELARLDARYAGRQQEVPVEEWAQYQAERTRLKEAAESAALARRRRSP